MTASLWALAAGATLFGLLASPLLGQSVQRFVYHGAAPHLESLSAMWSGFLLGTLVALAGLASAWLLYASAHQPLRAPVWLTRVLQQRFYLDRAYYRLFADPLTRLTQPIAWADRRLLDGAIDLAAYLVAVVADALRRAQTGRLEHYAWTLAAGTVILVLALTLGGGG
jgi:NADH-quinone oxidoreductase subunit L